MEATRWVNRAQPSCAARQRRSRAPLDSAAMVRTLPLLLAGALALCGGWLMIRRLAGALVEPLADAQLVGIGALAALCAAAARLLWWHVAAFPSRSALSRTIDWLPMAALALVGASAALPGNSLVAVILFWGLIAAEEVGAGFLGRFPRRGPRAFVGANLRLLQRSKSHLRDEEPFEPEIETSPAEVSQQLTRERTAGGREMIHGTMRTAFAVGQRTAIEHLVFCPMLPRAAAITAVVLDESECSVRATHIYRYGARLEIKLSEPCDEPCEVLIRYEVLG
jgi:hypothetical protein